MKLKICFYNYLKDRLANTKKIQRLKNLIKKKSQNTSLLLPT